MIRAAARCCQVVSVRVLSSTTRSKPSLSLLIR
jgi:hypothetical protein